VEADVQDESIAESLQEDDGAALRAARDGAQVAFAA
jgi:hypothetical protein